MRQPQTARSAATIVAALLSLAASVDAARANTNLVSFRSNYDAGTIIVSMSQRKL